MTDFQKHLLKTYELIDKLNKTIQFNNETIKRNEKNYQGQTKQL